MIREIKAVLAFYANAEHYVFNTDPYAAYDSVIAEDKGRRAAHLLVQINALAHADDIVP